MWWNQLLEKRFDQEVQQYITEQQNFAFVKFLGFGSYGRTYLIEEKSTRKLYVLKCLRLKHRRHKKTKNKFMQEIEILQRLTMSSIPSIQLTGTIQNIPFFIMDYINGQTFEQLIFDEGQTFTISESLLITKQLLQQIIVLHENGIVHRDLRTPNILFANQQLYIIDFGLASVKKNVDFSSIQNPKRAENHISDLYFVGHFLLYLLYSSYKPSTNKEKPWQEELALPNDVKNFLERLLWIQQPFNSSKEALQLLPVNLDSADKQYVRIMNCASIE